MERECMLYATLALQSGRQMLMFSKYEIYEIFWKMKKKSLKSPNW